MDIVFLRDLRIETVIGIYDWEREIKQTVVLDLEMATDVARAAASDRIEDALDYKAVAKRLITFVGESRYQLVETLAEACARIVREVGDLWRRARESDKHLATLALDTQIRFATPADRAAFTQELQEAVLALASRYHEEGASGGRDHRLVVVAHPAPRARKEE